MVMCDMTALWKAATTATLVVELVVLLLHHLFLGLNLKGKKFSRNLGLCYVSSQIRRQNRFMICPFPMAINLKILLAKDKRNREGEREKHTRKSPE